jgi:hypothetical protein
MLTSEGRADRLTALSSGALAAVLLLFTAASFRKVWGADFWWQYATGRLVAEHGIPREDVFSYTMTGQPWIEMRWLYCYVLYHLRELSGAGGVIVAKWLTLTAFDCPSRGHARSWDCSIASSPRNPTSGPASS